MYFAVGFHKVGHHASGMGEISEYASLDAAAFRNAECDPVYFEQPVECVIRRAKAGESLDEYYDGRGSLSDGLANQWKVWEITCKLCGLSVPFDILETKSPEYDENKNAILNMTLAKSGAARRRDEARAQMDEMARALNFDIKMEYEANRIFDALHKFGGSSGGRGFKTVAAASLRLASLNAGKPVGMKKICDLHPESPIPKVAKRLISDAKKNGVIEKTKQFTALERLEIIASQMGADAQAVEFAKPYAQLDLQLFPDAHAAAALYLAGNLKGMGNKFSGAAIQRATGISRRRIYRAAKVIQPRLKRNPPKERSNVIPASIVQDLRRIRRQ